MSKDQFMDWYNQIGKKILYILLGCLGVYIFLKYILELVLPFLIAWVVASLLHPIVTWLNKVVKIPRGFGTLLAMTTILSGVIAVITMIVKQLWIQIQSFADSFGYYKENIQYVFDKVELQMQQLGEHIPLPSAFASLDDLINEVLGLVGGFLDEIVKGTYAVVSHVPNGLFFVIVMFIAIFFMTKDYKDISDFIKAQIPSRTIHHLTQIKNGLKEALGGYVKTQLILMCFTFSICLTGLVVLRRQYALLIALGIAVFDAFPIFGSGAILIPWAAYYLITGEYMIGVGLLAIYGIIVVMRQIMEPKVLSTQIGIYALVTLMSMYIGLKLMGVLGMIIGPVTMVMIKTLQRIGVLPEFKKPFKG